MTDLNEAVALEIWYRARDAELGVVVEVGEAAEAVRTFLYKVRTAAGDPSLDDLSIRNTDNTTLCVYKKLETKLE